MTLEARNVQMRSTNIGNTDRERLKVFLFRRNVERVEQ